MKVRRMYYEKEESSVFAHNGVSDAVFVSCIHSRSKNRDQAEQKKYQSDGRGNNEAGNWKNQKRCPMVKQQF